MNIDSISNFLRPLKQQTKQLADFTSSLNHTEPNIKTYMNRIKKMTLQSLDVLNEIERQAVFLRNEISSYENRKKFNENRKKNDEQRRNR